METTLTACFAPKYEDQNCLGLEARVGIEPTNKGFADPGLTTLTNAQSIPACWIQRFCPRVARPAHPKSVCLRSKRPAVRIGPGVPSKPQSFKHLRRARE